MAPHQKFDTGYYRTPEGEKNLKDWKELCSRSNRAIIDTNDLPGRSDTFDYACRQGITMEELRVRISSTLGYVVRELIGEERC